MKKRHINNAKKMYIVDKNNNEFLIQDPENYEFFYTMMNTLIKANSSITVVNKQNENVLLKTREIQQIYIAFSEGFSMRIL